MLAEANQSIKQASDLAPVFWFAIFDRPFFGPNVTYDFEYEVNVLTGVFYLNVPFVTKSN